ncbi:MAG: hypothetical protein JNJ61_24940 [Anaerolineae bacterium]|nr:hypothetical protein [Anaerolineae bacterium]
MKLTKINSRGLETYRGSAIDFSPDGSLLGYGGFPKGSFYLWDIDVSDVARIPCRNDRLVTGISFCPDQFLIAIASDDSHLDLFHRTTHEHVLQLKGHSAPINELVFSSSNRLASTSLSEDKTLLWNTITGEVIKALEFGAVAFSPNGQLLAISGDHGIALYSSADGEIVSRMTREKRGYSDITFHSDSTILAAINSNDQIEIWHIESRQIITTLGNPYNGIHKISFIPMCDVLVSASIDQSTIYFWHTLGDEKLLYSLYSGFDFVSSIAFRADGTYMAFGINGGIVKEVQLWKIDDRSDTTMVHE